MPFYEYVCTECGEQTEVLQRLSDPPETECPSCHQPALIKQVSAAGFRLKGGGWYETDFKSGNQRNLEGEKAGKTEDVKSESGETKTEAKVDAKPASGDGAAPKSETKTDAKPAPKKNEGAAAAAPKPAAPPKPSDTKTPA